MALQVYTPYYVFILCFRAIWLDGFDCKLFTLFIGVRVSSRTYLRVLNLEPVTILPPPVYSLKILSQIKILANILWSLVEPDVEMLYLPDLFTGNYWRITTSWRLLDTSFQMLLSFIYFASILSQVLNPGDGKSKDLMYKMLVEQNEEMLNHVNTKKKSRTHSKFPQYYGSLNMNIVLFPIFSLLLKSTTLAQLCSKVLAFIKQYGCSLHIFCFHCLQVKPSKSRSGMSNSSLT